MANSAERQRKRRHRLRESGLAEVTVTVRERDAARLRHLARALNEEHASAFFLGTRLPAVIRSLRAARADLERRGIVHAGVFGSTARGEDRPDSDVDIAIDVDPAVVRDVIDMIGAVEAVRAALPGDLSVEVADRRTLKPGIREQAERDMIHAF